MTERCFDDLLRDGLRGLPVPDAGAEFDDRVVAALRDKWSSPTSRIWNRVRPTLLAALSSMTATFVAIMLLTGSPPAPRSITPAAPVGPRLAVDWARLDSALDSRTATAHTLLACLTETPPPAPGLAIEPRRRFSSGHARKPTYLV